MEKSSATNNLMFITNRLMRRTFNFFAKMEPIGFTGQVKLTPLEERLFEVFRKAAAKSGKPLVLRVAGGWVRDKVLNPKARFWAVRTTTSTSLWIA
jgi:hypothetical protein